jgi:hypothetical protein
MASDGAGSRGHWIPTAHDLADASGGPPSVGQIVWMRFLAGYLVRPVCCLSFPDAMAAADVVPARGSSSAGTGAAFCNAADEQRQPRNLGVRVTEFAIPGRS